MSTTTPKAAPEQEQRRDRLAQRIFEATVGALELFSIHLGRRHGLYEALAVAGPMSPPELAERAGLDRRYAREWLEQQAVAGFLVVDDLAARPDERRFTLPAGHVEVLARVEDLSHVAPFASMIVGIGGALPAVVDAYRFGGGVPYPH
jgi:hypothetical protein